MVDTIRRPSCILEITPSSHCDLFTLTFDVRLLKFIIPPWLGHPLISQLTAHFLQNFVNLQANQF